MIATQQLQRKGGATTRKEKICHQMGGAVYLFFEIYTQGMSRVRPQLADFYIRNYKTEFRSVCQAYRTFTADLPILA